MKPATRTPSPKLRLLKQRLERETLRREEVDEALKARKKHYGQILARHAKATSVVVKIEKKSNGISLAIKDDGRSFQVDRVLLSKRFKVESAPGKGTTVRASLPLDKTKDQT